MATGLWLERRVWGNAIAASKARRTPTESYIRDDIACGIASCLRCPPTSATSLSKDADHFLLPDAEALLSFLEIFELPDISGIIFLRSTLQQVLKTGTMRKASRMRTVYSDMRRGCVMFDNLHCLSTVPCRQELAKLEQRDLSLWLLLRAAVFYSQHAEGKTPVFIVSDTMHTRLDPESPRACNSASFDLLSEAYMQAMQAGVSISSSADYFRAKWSQCIAVQTLLDSVEASAAEGGTDNAGSRGDGYEPHLNERSVHELMSAGQLVEGTISVTNSARHQATVTTAVKLGEQPGMAVAISGRLSLNRSLHGDRVAVRLISGDLPSRSHLAVGHPSTDDIDPYIESEPFADDEAQKPAGIDKTEQRTATGTTVLAGRVVAVLGREPQDLVCCLSADDMAQQSSRQGAVLALPMDRRMPKIRIRTRTADSLRGQRFIVRLDGWPVDSYYPTGHLVRVLGSMDDITVETEAILVANGIRWQPFCSGALAELPQVQSARDWQVSAEQVAARRDLRNSPQFIVSIDPPGCTDVDDALGVARLPTGGWEVGVHIADVSWFVKEGGFLDGEAAARCTTVYLVDRRLDMLPALLSEELCSLRAQQDRYAMSVIWTLTDDLEVESTWFGRTIIRSAYQLEYQQVHDILEDNSAASVSAFNAAEKGKINEAASLLSKLADKRKAQRSRDGAIDLISAELKFDTQDDGRPSKVVAKQQLPVMGVVAELMIMANSSVAERIFQSFPGYSLLRRHPAPRQEDFEAVASICREAGIKFDSATNVSLSSSLRALEEKIRSQSNLDPALGVLCKSLLTRSMAEAKYFSTGESNGMDTMHYGLALQYYTHFTSPIRRYADVVAHRQLMAALTNSKLGHTHKTLHDTASTLNLRHREAKMAQRKCSDLYLLLLLAKHPQVHRALIYDIRDGHQLLLFLDGLQLKTSVRLRSYNGDVKPPEGAAGSMGPSSTSGHLQLVSSGASVKLVDEGRNVQMEYRRLQRVWVRISATTSSTHGPALHTSLLDDSHQDVKATVVAKLKNAHQSVSHHPEQAGGKGVVSEDPWGDEKAPVSPTRPAPTSHVRMPLQATSVASMLAILHRMDLTSGGVADAHPSTEAATPRQKLVAQGSGSSTREVQGKASRAKAQLHATIKSRNSPTWQRRAERLRLSQGALLSNAKAKLVDAGTIN